MCVYIYIYNIYIYIYVYMCRLAHSVASISVKE